MAMRAPHTIALPRRAALIGMAAVIAIGAGSAQAQSREPAEAALVDAMVRNGLERIEAGRTPTQRLAAVRAFLAAHADLARIASFVLGRASRTATPAERSAFVDAFSEHLARRLEGAFAGFPLASLQRRGGILRAPGDVIVSYRAQVNGAERRGGVRAQLRSGDWKLVDVEAEGVWLAQLQQGEIAAMLDEPGMTIARVAARLAG